MKRFSTIKKILEQQKPDLEKRFHVKEIGVFGSYVRNEQKKRSDVDILVDFSQPIGLDFIELGYYLEDILGLKVDLVTPRAIKKHMKQSILSEVVFL
ncbi:MAG: nucleotidyltransferase family protein [Ignavibacteriales bacterium]|nr:nucleotidyltransferase family protein [Ignavibacteriales bacterium]